MIEFLINLDIKIFLYLNSFHSESLDSIMFFISGKLSWIPLYITIIFFIFKKYKLKTSLILLFLFFMLILISDQSSVHLFKFTFKRLRPCFNPNIADIVHIVKYPGGKYGFVSSHATNGFAFAVFTSLLFKNKILTISLIFWAMILSYSRVYLGVHYPADILGGALLGTFWAFLLYKIFIFYQKRKTKETIQFSE